MSENLYETTEVLYCPKCYNFKDMVIEYRVNLNVVFNDGEINVDLPETLDSIYDLHTKNVKVLCNICNSPVESIETTNGEHHTPMSITWNNCVQCVRENKSNMDPHDFEMIHCSHCPMERSRTHYLMDIHDVFLKEEGS